MPDRGQGSWLTRTPDAYNQAGDLEHAARPTGPDIVFGPYAPTRPAYRGQFGHTAALADLAGSAREIVTTDLDEGHVTVLVEIIQRSAIRAWTR
jgi:hypothetical protein